MQTSDIEFYQKIHHDEIKFLCKRVADLEKQIQDLEKKLEYLKDYIPAYRES